MGDRSFAAFALDPVSLLAIPVGILRVLLIADLEPSRLDPFRSTAYFTAYGIVLPFAFVATAGYLDNVLRFRIDRRPCPRTS